MSQAKRKDGYPASLEHYLTDSIHFALASSEVITILVNIHPPPSVAQVPAICASNYCIPTSMPLCHGHLAVELCCHQELQDVVHIHEAMGLFVGSSFATEDLFPEQS